MNRYETNPYEATLGNTVSRMSAWLRGALRRYRKPIFVTLAATGTLVIGVSAGLAPAKTPPPVDIASR
nr:hypothetical protein [Polymorphobacter sp.]